MQGCVLVFFVYFFVVPYVRSARGMGGGKKEGMWSFEKLRG
jgi:hypothetical protein